MNRFLYSLVFYFSIPFAIFRLLIKDTHDASWTRKLKNQFGIVEKITGRVIWTHCVSVGEFNASKPLIEKLMSQYPNHQIVISTTTITGFNAVNNHYKNKIKHCFFPFDIPFILDSFIRQINPEICILLETEIWPNLIYTLKKKNIPSALINARLSDKSFQRYDKYSAKLVKASLNSLSLICAQNSFSSDRFISLGANQDKMITTGSLKFDSDNIIDDKSIKTLKKIIGERKITVFASTREGEEKQIIKSYINSADNINSLLIIIPRHPQRFNEVFKLAKVGGLKVERRSTALECSKDTDILIGDTMGEMMSYYSVCDLAFIGGSLSDNGCQNMLEAASLSKPIIFGPSVFNFEEISKKLLMSDAAIQVANADELMSTISDLLKSDQRREQLGVNAKKTFDQNRGAVNKILEVITPLIKI
ncbi:3-deoxy-D-manno-octulosonic acid transferase [Candidatus Pseudothioglobus singularis]|nr:3-deoxy-D-manno-octulosonic acid transferase [Candidatus Pseudothioglobus singularis]